MKVIDIVAAVLLVVGGLNWGLVGLLNFDLVATLTGANFGETNFLSRLVYVLVGASAAYQAFGLKGIQHRWGVRGGLVEARA